MGCLITKPKEPPRRRSSTNGERPITDYDHFYKILTLGDAGTGKSSFILKYCEDKFPEGMMPVIDFKTRIIDSDLGVCKLQVWDTSGQERFRKMTKSYYKGANIVIICVNGQNRDSLESARRWLLDVEHFTEGKCFTVLLKLKCDLEDKYPDEEICCFAEKMGITYSKEHQVSSLTGKNVDEFMFKIINKDYRYFLDNRV
eukprot:TRINITY_DN2637_c0_g1_i1.p1 TRINITY_DN2637_c0_g1~~TRINITY_DN2637_c0_g1_i1.p1  ORF type:complete len:200 (-),score=39.69 TRINITY_DN2637_c0_g1_i1:22-621(-)